MDMYHTSVSTLPKVAPPGLMTLEQFEAARLGRTVKQYVNLSLPGGAKFCPIVMSADDAESVIARVAYVDGKRDVQVVHGQGKSWRALGSNGHGLTGTDGNFLSDARVGPNGKLWVLASYSVPSNPDRGGMSFLYCFEKGQWVLKAPRKSHGTMDRYVPNWDSGLHFFGRNGPCHILHAGNAGVRFLALEGGAWKSVPAQDALQKAMPSKGCYPQACKRKNDTWFLWCTRGKKRSVLKSLRIGGTLNNDVIGPTELESWPKEVYLTSASVSPGGTIAVRVYDSARRRGIGRLYRPDAKGGYNPSDLSLPFPKRVDFEVLQYSPTGALYAVWNPKRIWHPNGHPQELTVAQLVGGKWEVLANVKQRKQDGRIFSPRVFFKQNGTPIVVWEDFFPL